MSEIALSASDEKIKEVISTIHGATEDHRSFAYGSASYLRGDRLYLDDEGYPVLEYTLGAQDADSMKVSYETEVGYGGGYSAESVLTIRHRAACAIDDVVQVCSGVAWPPKKHWYRVEQNGNFVDTNSLDDVIEYAQMVSDFVRFDMARTALKRTVTTRAIGREVELEVPESLYFTHSE